MSDLRSQIGGTLSITTPTHLLEEIPCMNFTEVPQKLEKMTTAMFALNKGTGILFMVFPQPTQMDTEVL